MTAKPLNFAARAAESSRILREHFKRENFPSTVVILGSGFKGFEQRLENRQDLDLSRVKHFPIPTVAGHGVSLVLGCIAQQEICVLTGRVHMYEGYDAQDVVYPLRILAKLGVRQVLLTNAAGSVDPSIQPGQVVVIQDQINLTGRNCLIGGDAIGLGPMFVDMGDVFDASWRQAILQANGLQKFLPHLVEGVYAGLLGPTYETPAETKMLRHLGANVVGMSTVQEVIAARQMQLRIACLSFVTNMTGGLGSHLKHEDVLSLVNANKAKLHDLLAAAACS